MKKKFARLLSLLLVFSLLLCFFAIPVSALDADKEFPLPLTEPHGSALCPRCMVPTGLSYGDYNLPSSQTAVSKCKNCSTAHVHTTMAVYEEFKCLNYKCPGYSVSAGGYYFYRFEYVTGTTCPYGSL